MPSYYDYRPKKKKSNFNWTSAGQNALSTGLTTYATTGNPYIAAGSALVGGYLGGRSGPFEDTFDPASYNKAFNAYQRGAMADLRQGIESLGMQTGQRLASQGLYGSPLGQSIIQNNQNYALNQGLAGINQARFQHEMNLANMQFQGQQVYDQQMADQYERLIGTIGLAVPLAYNKWQNRPQPQQQLNNRFDALANGTQTPIGMRNRGMMPNELIGGTPAAPRSTPPNPAITSAWSLQKGLRQNPGTNQPAGDWRTPQTDTDLPPWTTPTATPTAKTPTQASTAAILGQEDADAITQLFGEGWDDFDTPSSPFLQNLEQLAPQLPAAPTQPPVTNVQANPGATMAHPNAPSYVMPPIEVTAQREPVVMPTTTVTAQRPPFEPNRELAFAMEGSAPNVRMPPIEVTAGTPTPSFDGGAGEPPQAEPPRPVDSVGPRWGWLPLSPNDPGWHPESPTIPSRPQPPQPELLPTPSPSITERPDYSEIPLFSREFLMNRTLEENEATRRQLRADIINQQTRGGSENQIKMLQNTLHLLNKVMTRQSNMAENPPTATALGGLEQLGDKSLRFRAQPRPAPEVDPFEPAEPGSAYTADYAIDYIKFGEGPFLRKPTPDPTEGINVGWGRSISHNGLDVQNEIIPMLRASGYRNFQIQGKLRDVGIASNVQGHVRLTDAQFNQLFPFGVTEQMSEMLLANDIKNSETELTNILGSDVYYALTPNRQAVLLDMMHTLGANRIQSFKNFLKMIRAGNYYAAAQEMKYVSPDNSKTLTDWYQQVKKRRAEPLIEAMIKG